MHEAEELPCPIVRKKGGEIAPCLAGNIDQKAGEVVSKRSPSAGTARGLESGLAVVESIKPARAEGLLLKQSVANSPQVNTKLDRVIAHNLGPGVGKVNVGF